MRQQPPAKTLGERICASLSIVEEAIAAKKVEDAKHHLGEAIYWAEKLVRIEKERTYQP